MSPSISVLDNPSRGNLAYHNNSRTYEPSTADDVLNAWHGYYDLKHDEMNLVEPIINLKTDDVNNHPLMTVWLPKLLYYDEGENIT